MKVIIYHDDNDGRCAAAITLKALIEKGLVKANNFKNSQNKIAYVYLLTPQGLERKAKLTLRFLKRKIEEFEQVKLEIEQLRREADALNGTGSE